MRFLNKYLTGPFIGLYLLLFLADGRAQTPTPPIIPTPAVMTLQQGSFEFNTHTPIITDKASAKATAFLTDYLKTNYQWQNKGNSSKQAIHITTAGSSDLPAEGYRLSITPKTITLIGKDAGIFYGIQTLIQLLPSTPKSIVNLPCLQITDQPRFAYRGLMLDVSRHFFTVNQIKNMLDLMAGYKLNCFHWHLTDDQGWRLEIKSLPKLTQVGAWRVPRIEFSGNTLPPQPGEKATDGGFYTQEQVKDILKYAADRHIEVIPEIDVPGHSMAAVASYPELCVTKDTSIKVSAGDSFSKWFPKGGFEMSVDNTLNPANEQVYHFLDQVFTEVAALFPSKYIHIGGDECYHGYWEKDATVQAFMKQHQLADTHGLQQYFISRLNKIIRAKGKELIGWDEIFDSNANEQLTVMNRFGEKGAIAQIKKGLDIVLTPGYAGFYFDYAQSSSDMEPSSHGGNAPLSRSFNFNPAFSQLTEEDNKHILGIEACIWTEHIETVSKLQFMTLPRLLGLAETSWSSQANKDEAQFTQQVLPAHLLRFDREGINYRVPTAVEQIDTTIHAASYQLVAHNPFPGARVFYTLNNIAPNETDHEYTGPIKLIIPQDKKMVVKTIVITPSGRRSVVTRLTLDNQKAVN